jgi:hypothetical protein
MKARCWRPPESVCRGEADALDRLVDDRAVAASERPEQPSSREPSRRNHLANGGRRLGAEFASLGQVAEFASPREVVCGLAEEQGMSGKRPFQAQR